MTDLQVLSGKRILINDLTMKLLTFFIKYTMTFMLAIEILFNFIIFVDIKN